MLHLSCPSRGANVPSWKQVLVPSTLKLVAFSLPIYPRPPISSVYDGLAGQKAHPTLARRPALVLRRRPADVADVGTI
jgi:hypothetical protein